MPQRYNAPTSKHPFVVRHGVMMGSGPERGAHYRLMDGRMKRMGGFGPPPVLPAAPSDQLYGGRPGKNKRRGGAVEPIPQPPVNKMARIMDFLSK